MERFAEDPELIGQLRERLWQEGELSARVLDGKQQEGAKFSDYFEHDEKLAKVPRTGRWPCSVAATKAS